MTHIRSLKHEQGATLLFVIAVLLTVSILGVGIYTLVSRPGVNQAVRVSHDRVIYLAQSGVNWAAAVYNATNGTPQDFGETLAANPYIPTTGSVTLGNFTQPGSGNSTEIWVNATAHVAGNSYTLLKWIGLYDPAAPVSPVDAPPGAAQMVISSIEENMLVLNQNTIDGNIAGAKVVLGNQVTVQGNIIGTDDLILENHSKVTDNARTEEIEGSVCVEGDLYMYNHTLIEGDAYVHGDVVLGSNSATIQGNLVADGDVRLGNKAVIGGNVNATGTVTLGASNSEIAGNVLAGGDVVLGSSTLIRGNVDVRGSVRMGWSSEISGRVRSMGSIDMSGGGNTIEGDAVAEGNIVLGWESDIQGNILQNTTISPAISAPGSPPSCSAGICKPRLFDLDQDMTSGSGITYGELIDAADDLSIAWKRDSSNPLPPVDDSVDHAILTQDYDGIYGDLVLGGKNRVYLTVGTYYFKSITTGTKPELYLDLTNRSAAPDYQGITIFVEQGVEFGNQLSIYVKSTASGGYEPMDDVDPSLAGYVYIESGDTFIFGNGNEWFGTIMARNTSDTNDRAIAFSNDTDLIGSYHAVDGIAASANALDVYYVPAQYALQHPEQWVCE